MFGVFLLKGETYSDHSNDLMVLLLVLQFVRYAIHIPVSSESQQNINHMYQNISVL